MSNIEKLRAELERRKNMLLLG